VTVAVDMMFVNKVPYSMSTANDKNMKHKTLMTSLE